MSAANSNGPQDTAAAMSSRPARRTTLETTRTARFRSARRAASPSRGGWLLSILIVCGSFAQSAGAADLTVTVDGVPSAKGTVLLELDDSDAGWDNKAKPVATAGVKAEKGGVTYTFKNVPPGTYAVGVVHDENDNGKLDTNFLGIPKEGYGFSNNTSAMRKPTFKESHFDIGEQDVSIVIHLAHAL